jgi:hypothetical protein
MGKRDEYHVSMSSQTIGYEPVKQAEILASFRPPVMLADFNISFSVPDLEPFYIVLSRESSVPFHRYSIMHLCMKLGLALSTGQTAEIYPIPVFGFQVIMLSFALRSFYKSYTREEDSEAEVFNVTREDEHNHMDCLMKH